MRLALSDCWTHSNRETWWVGLTQCVHHLHFLQQISYPLWIDQPAKGGEHASSRGRMHPGTTESTHQRSWSPGQCCFSPQHEATKKSSLDVMQPAGPWKEFSILLQSDKGLDLECRLDCKLSKNKLIYLHTKRKQRSFVVHYSASYNFVLEGPNYLVKKIYFFKF